MEHMTLMAVCVLGEQRTSSKPDHYNYSLSRATHKWLWAVKTS